MKKEEILEQIHEGHLGLNKCQMHTKETVYWPGLNDQLETTDSELSTLPQVLQIKEERYLAYSSRS